MDERCVVGFDDSDPSRAALRWALTRGLPVVLAHVIDPEMGMMGDDYLSEERRRGAELVAATLAALHLEDVGPKVDVALLEGPVAWALAEYCDPGDLLVVGTHKTGFLHGRVLGSRSVEIGMLARSDVMVIPHAELRFRSGVVAGVEREPALAAVVEAAASEAAERAEELLLIHSTAQTGHREGQLLLAEALAMVREIAPDLVVRSRLSNRAPSELLLDAGRERALLVVGTGGRDRTRSPIGSVLHDILLNITAPTRIAHGTDAS